MRRPMATVLKTPARIMARINNSPKRRSKCPRCGSWAVCNRIVHARSHASPRARRAARFCLFWGTYETAGPCPAGSSSGANLAELVLFLNPCLHPPGFDSVTRKTMGCADKRKTPKNRTQPETPRVKRKRPGERCRAASVKSPSRLCQSLFLAARSPLSGMILRRRSCSRFSCASAIGS